MTRLVGQGGTPHDLPPQDDRRFDFDRAGEREFGDGREKARTLDLEEKKRGLGARIAGGGTEDRSEAFQAAMKRHGAGDGPGEGQPTEAAILAASLAMRSAAPASAPQVEASTPRPVTERILAVADACERAMRAELHLQMGRPISVELGIGGMVPGLDSLKVSLDGSTLEVAFVKAAEAGAAEASAETMQAAQALAEHLRARFPRRTIRVVEIGEGAADAPATRSDGAAGLAALFQRGGSA